MPSVPRCKRPGCHRQRAPGRALCHRCRSREMYGFASYKTPYVCGLPVDAPASFQAQHEARILAEQARVEREEAEIEARLQAARAAGRAVKVPPRPRPKPKPAVILSAEVLRLRKLCQASGVDPDAA
jgi:hypothetical protein